jgi:hypothetical protein
VHDYSNDQEEAAPEQVALLGKLVDDLAAAEREVEEAQRQLTAAQERARKLRENDIPELMNSLAMKQVLTTDGLSVKLREEVRAHLPKDPARRNEAFDWLRKNGHGGLIKHEISVKFTRGQEAIAEKVWQALSEMGVTLNAVRKDDVHHQTLCAFLREQIRSGANVPLPTFGGFIQKFAEVKKG